MLRPIFTTCKDSYSQLDKIACNIKSVVISMDEE